MSTELGGPQLRSLRIAKSIERSGITTEFLIPNGNGEFNKKASQAGFTIHDPNISRPRPLTQVSKNINYLKKLLPDQRLIQNIINRRNIDIVHCQNPMNLNSAIAGAHSQAKLLWHFNGKVVPWPLTLLLGHSARIMADEIILSSEVVRHDFFSGDQVGEIIHPPVDTELFDPNDITSNYRHNFNFEPETTLIGAIGNINPAKGYEDFIKAIDYVSKSSPNIKAIIVGRETKTRQKYVDKVNDLISEFELQNTVRFLGWQSDVPKILSMFDIFVLPSRRETGPMTLLEAMAMEKPIVTTNVGIVNENFNHRTHGWVVPPNDHEKLAEGIISILDKNQFQQRCGRNSRKVVKQKFSINKIANDYKNLYKQYVQ